MEDFFFEDLDCDHFSVKIPTQYLARLAQFYQLSAKSIVDIKDDRVRDCIAVQTGHGPCGGDHSPV